MKFLKACPILIGIFVITIALLVTSFALEDSTYSDYSENYEADKAPHFILVFKGLSEGVYPWSEKEPEPDQGFAEEPVIREKEDGDSDVWRGVVSDGLNSGDGMYVSGNALLDKSLSENSISDNSISGNDPDRTYEFTTVDEDYFTDALFIGDSRTVGLSEYCEPLDERATFYAKVSLTIYGVMDKQFIKQGDSKISVEQALSENQFAKIYIMLGLNEIGTGTAETFAEEYGKVIERIRELQPDAIIFIQGIMHVAERKSKADKYFNNPNINLRNEAIAQFADNKTIFYMDMNESVDDENGNLLAELTGDDVHLKASAYQRWYDFLLEHGIVKD